MVVVVNVIRLFHLQCFILLALTKTEVARATSTRYCTLSRDAIAVPEAEERHHFARERLPDNGLSSYHFPKLARQGRIAVGPVDRVTFDNVIKGRSAIFPLS